MPDACRRSACCCIDHYRYGTDGLREFFWHSGLKTFASIPWTTALAIMVGWFVAMAVSPGVGHDLASYGQSVSTDTVALHHLANHVDASPFHKIEMISVEAYSL